MSYQASESKRDESLLQPAGTALNKPALFVWLNLLSPGLASFYVLSPPKALEFLCLELVTILVICGLLILHPYLYKIPLTALSVIAPFNLWYILAFHVPLSSATLQFCLAMPAKAYSELLLSVVDTPAFLVAIGVSGISGWICWQKLDISISRKTRQAIFAAGLFILSAALVDLRVVAPIKPHPPLVDATTAVSAFPTNFLHALSCMLLPRAYAETGHRATAVKVSREGKIRKETVVYVIGESARADHWHRNGYSRETTPFLDKENIINFSKVRSISDCTNISVPGLLGMLSARQLYDLNQACNEDPAGNRSVPGHSDFRGVPGHATLFDYFHSAGFFTSAIINYNQDTLPIDGVGAKIDSVEVTQKNTRYDTQMLPYLDKSLESPFDKKFIVLHTYGSHWQYAKRYPPEFNRFHDGSSQFKEHIAYYDNSILATDSFLHVVLDRLKTVQGKVVLVYTSDHGDGDKSKMELHCSVPSNYNTLVPLFFWSNGAIPPAKLRTLKENADRYVSQDQVATTLLDLVGIGSDKLELDSALTREKAQAGAYYSFGSNGKLYSCSMEGCREAF